MALHVDGNCDHGSRHVLQVAPAATLLREFDNVPHNVGDHLHRASFDALHEYTVSAQVHLGDRTKLPLNAELGLGHSLSRGSSNDLLRSFVADDRRNRMLLVVKEADRATAAGDGNQAVRGTEIEPDDAHVTPPLVAGRSRASAPQSRARHDRSSREP